MLRTLKKEINLNVSRCQVVNDGVPFLRITCDSVLVTPDDRRFILNNKNWFLDGAGGPIKQKDVAQFINRHHMPVAQQGVFVSTGPSDGGIDRNGFAPGVGYFTTDLVIDLFFPRGVLDIHFDKYNDEREAFERNQREEEELKKQQIEAQNQQIEIQRKKDEKLTAVDGFRRKFTNLDLDTNEPN